MKILSLSDKLPEESKKYIRMCKPLTVETTQKNRCQFNWIDEITLLPSFFDAGQKMGLFALTTAKKIGFRKKTPYLCTVKTTKRITLLTMAGLKKG